MSFDLLLDTHALMWMAQGDTRAKGLVRIADDPASTVTVSAVTWMEIAIKHSIGKLSLDVAAARAAARRHQALELHFTGDHAEQLERLPQHHGDPFDRMLIAQAMSEELTIVTVDPAFESYAGLLTLWP